MKAKLSGTRTAGIAIALLAWATVVAEPLADAAAAKVAAAKSVTENLEAARAALEDALSERSAAARAAYSASLDLRDAKKALSAADDATKAAAEAAVKEAEAKVAAAKKIEDEKNAASKRAADRVTEARRASYPVLAAKTAAEEALAREAAAERADAAKAAAERANATAAALKKAEAARTAADKTCSDCIAKATAARKTVEGTTEAEKEAVEKAAQEAEAKAAAARKALADSEAALPAAKGEAAKAKAAAEQAAKAKTAAEKDLADKVKANAIAQETARGSDLFVALTALDHALNGKAAAEKTLKEKMDLEAKAKAACNAEKAVAEKALAEQHAAEKALAAAPEEQKAEAKKTCDAKTAAAERAAEKAAAAQTACDKAAAETAAARKVVEEKARAIPPARDREAAARAVVLGGLTPMPGSDWDRAKARHLMVHAGFGGTPAEVQKLHEMGLHDAVDHFVEIYDRPVANLEFDPARLHRPEPWEARLDPEERQAMTVRFRNPERRQQAKMRRWWLRRMAESPRPLQEKLTLFWHDHFAVQYKKNYRTHLLFKQNQLFRTYAVDNFAALLRGIVHDPAMIAYLDNHVNFKDRGNENLGREILELFSMGEGRGYTEEDLREASRALTGYTYDSWTEQFRFLAARHDGEPKKLLGSTGNWSGDDLVDLILRRPETSRYITEKLVTFLAYEQPDPQTVEKLAHVMRYCSYDLRPMLKNLFLSEEFYSEKAMGTHIKGPVELAVGAIRDLGIENVDYAAVDSAVSQMGQTLFEPPNVAGWNEGRTWINAERILIRYNQMARLLEQPNVDLVALLEGHRLDTPRQIVDEIAKICLVIELDSEQSATLAEYLGDLPPPAEWKAKRDQVNARLRAILVLLMSTPEAQLG